MRQLLQTLHLTLFDIGNFGLLLLLFMYIYILIGLQFFANRFHFADDGSAVGIGEEGYPTSDVPRSNFDSLLNGFVTVFEASGVVDGGAGRTGSSVRLRLRKLPYAVKCHYEEPGSALFPVVVERCCRRRRRGAVP